MSVLLILAQNDFLDLKTCMDVRHIYGKKILSHQIHAAKSKLDISRTIYIGDSTTEQIKTARYHSFQYIENTSVNYGGALQTALPLIGHERLVIMHGGVWVPPNFFSKINPNTNALLYKYSNKKHKNKIGCVVQNNQVLNLFFDIIMPWSGCIILQADAVMQLKALDPETYNFKFDFEIYNSLIDDFKFVGYSRTFKACKRASDINEVESGKS